MNYVVIRLGESSNVTKVLGPFETKNAAADQTLRFAGVCEVHELTRPVIDPETRARALGYDSVPAALDALESMQKPYEETEHSAQIHEEYQGFHPDLEKAADDNVRVVLSRRTPQELDKGWAKLGSE